MEVLASFRFTQSALSLAALTVMCLCAPVARAADPDFMVSPASPLAGQEATFTPSDIPSGATVTWQYDAAGPFVADTTHTFADAGSYTVTMKVAEENGGPVTDYPKDVAVRPVAAFHREPGDGVVLETGQTATFTSDSSAGATLSWEIDGVALGGADSVTHSFPSAGTHVVRLEVEHNGQRNVAVSVLRVNGPPAAGFVWTPSDPVAGGEIRLYSISADAEGALASEAWELDGDGDFNDAFGPSAASTFTAGSHDVSLRVTDGDGVSRTVTRAIAVAAAPVVEAPPPAAPALMSPFPTVRLAGVVMPRGARIGVVEVRGAPRGASVTVRCSGRGCPFRSRRRIAETGRVRLSPFARFLAAGARVEVLVRAPRVIGRYVAFRIRAGKRPVRVDRCLAPGSTEPRPCT